MTLSHTKINSLLACQRQYKLRYIDRLEPISKAKPLTLGSAFHIAIDKGLDAGIDYLESRPAYDELGFNEKMTDQAIIKGAYGLYVDRWPQNGATTEVEFEIDIEGVQFNGRIDGVEDLGDHLALIENKLVGRIEAGKVQRLHMDRQIGLMALALQLKFQKPVRIVDYRWVKKPQIKQRQGETIGEYCDRLEADYKERPDFYAFGDKAFFDLDQEQITSEFLAWADLRDYVEGKGVYPRNTSNCAFCHFVPICSGDPDGPALFQRRADREPVVGSGEQARLA